MHKEVFLKKLGAQIVKVRERAGLSQKELALRFDKDKQSLNRLEKGRVSPTIYNLYLLCRELDIPLKDLLDFE
jgi:putative transcriptional regulator